MTNLAHLQLEAALPAIIADDPKIITRRREVSVDTFAEPEAYVQGPFTVRIEPQRLSTSSNVFDEKGSVSTTSFVLVGIDLPRTVTEGEAERPLFQHEDIITDQYGNQYRVNAPQYIVNRIVQVILELRG